MTENIWRRFHITILAPAAGQNIFDIKEFDHPVFKEGLKLIFDECGYSDHYEAMMK